MKPAKIFASFALVATLSFASVLPVAAGQATVTQVTATEKKEFKRPPYNPVSRWKEDWSGLRGLDRNRTGDAFDPLKFIPFNSDGSIWLSIGGGIRARVEHFSNFNFVPTLDDGYLLYHFLLHGDLHITNFVRVFVEGIDAEQTFRDLPGNQRTTDINAFDLNQGFLDINIPIGAGKLTLRGGREGLAFGKQRLVSPLPWGNAYRHWDGFSAILDIKGWNARAFWTEFSPVNKYEADLPDGQTKLWGFYATHGKPTDLMAGDLYFLGLNKEDNVAFNGTIGPEDRYTIGGRVFGTPVKDFDYEIEAAYQFGQVGDGDVSAWMLATEVGYTIKPSPVTPRLWLGFDYASGDDAAGGDVGTFNQLYPLGHAYFGYMDFVGRQNIIDVHPGASIKCASDKMTVKAEGHFFWLAESTDALYNAGGGVVRRGFPGASDEVGSEVDFVVNYKFNRHLDIEAGYSHFFPGNFIRQTGPSDDADFVYVQTQIYF